MNKIKELSELYKDLKKDPRWTKDIFTGKRGLSASDKSYIDHNGNRKSGELLVKLIWWLSSKKK